MTGVTPYAVGDQYDVLLYTHRTTRKDRPVTVSLGLRTGLTVFEGERRVGAASYPWTVLIAVLVALLRVSIVMYIFPAILVTVWLGAALAPFVLFLTLALIEARLSFDLSLFGRTIEPRRENGLLLFAVEVFLIGISAASVVFIDQFQMVLQLTLENILLALPIALGVVVMRAVVSYIGSESEIDRAPRPMENSVTTTEFNRLVEAVNYQLADGVTPIPRVPSDTSTPALPDAIIAEEIHEAFVDRIEATGHRGEAAMDLDDAFRRTIGEAYESPYDAMGSSTHTEE